MLAERGVDNTHVEENLARVSDLVELVDCLFELIVVITSEGRNPRLDFLCKSQVSAGRFWQLLTILLLTCFKDMAAMRYAAPHEGVEVW